MKSEKFDSKARLAHLGRVKVERHAALRRATDEHNQIRSTAGNARRDAARFDEMAERAPRAFGDGEPTERAAALAKAEAARKRAEDAEALLSDASARMSEAQEAFDAAARLHDRCAEFAQRHNLPLPARIDPDGVVHG